MLRRSPKISMYLVNARLVVRNAAKTVNTKLDLRNAANSLQIEGNWGCYLGTQPMGGGGVAGKNTYYVARRVFRKNLPYVAQKFALRVGGRGGGETEDGTIYIYNSMVIIILLYICM